MNIEQIEQIEKQIQELEIELNKLEEAREKHHASAVEYTQAPPP